MRVRLRMPGNCLAGDHESKIIVMALRKILEVSGTCVSVPGDDVDTDRIIPARYLKCVTFEGLGDFLFYDVRFQNGQPTNFSLNDPRFNGATILICGRNFGCGSSREHAPQAIYRYGFGAVVAEGGVAAVPGSSFYSDPTAGSQRLRFHFARKRETLEAAAEKLKALRSRLPARPASLTRG